ncbi:MAG: hypothetical protein Q9182_006050 [Xanthomendoza sp. 2 TL-2023]
MTPSTSTTSTSNPLTTLPRYKSTFSSTASRTLPPLRFNTVDKSCQHQSRPSPSPRASSSSTPPLVRHNSASSKSDSSTSPMTPNYPHDPLDQHTKSGPYFSQPHGHQNRYTYPAIGQSQNPFATSSYHFYQRDMANTETGNGMGAFNQQALLNLPPPLPYPNSEPTMIAPSPTKSHLPEITSLTTNHPNAKEKPTSQSASTQTNSSVSTSPTTASSSNTGPTPAKKKFPCPHATRFSCSDTFTTSGHAARHGKKHTGEKSVICPTCNKAFTRKDNMKQHERTHKNPSSRNGPEDNAFSLATTRPARDGRSRSPSAPTSTPSATTDSSDFNFAATPLMQRSEQAIDYQAMGRRTRTKGRMDTGSGQSEEDGEGESPGLDALAAAAFMG